MIKQKYEEKDKLFWMLCIAHDIGMYGNEEAAKILDCIDIPQDRGKMREVYYEVCRILQLEAEDDSSD